MKYILCDNVNDAFAEGFWHLKVEGRMESSRNGMVIVAPAPVVTEYLRPWERVLFNPIRDANPTFHLVEAIWMLAGRDDLKAVEPYNSKIGQFFEDNGRMHGAYGYRWREAFSKDQIYMVIEELRRNPDSRRAVMAMWDPDLDLGENKRDLPCNTHIYFDCRGDRLNMTVCNRSNDILWGAYGANVVHMSILQELIAAAVGILMGRYRQFSNNFHAYMTAPNVEYFLDNPPEVMNLYDDLATPQPLVAAGERFEDFLVDCDNFFDEGVPKFRTAFMREVAQPMKEAYLARKVGIKRRFTVTDYNDWHVAYNMWADRRDNERD